jgi:hypothetical protein
VFKLPPQATLLQLQQSLLRGLLPDSLCGIRKAVEEKALLSNSESECPS